MRTVARQATFVVQMVFIAALKTVGLRSIWVAREGCWKKGIINPLTDLKRSGT